MFRKLTLAAAIFGATASFGAEAYDYSIQCESCVTDSDFRAKARNLESLGGGKGGFFYVYNLGANTVQKWWINPSLGGGGGGAIPRAASPSATKSTPEPHVNVEVAKAHRLYIIGGNSLRPIYNVPIGHLGISAANDKTTYDVLRNNNLKAQIESALGDINKLTTIVNANVLASMIDIAQNASNVLGLKEKSFLLFRVVMSDGSYMDYILNISDTTADAKEESARTTAGQLIPTSQANVEGSWIDSENLQPLVEHLTALGVPVVYTGTGSYVTTISCTPTQCFISRNQR